MADFGKLYTIFDESFPAAMRGLCAKADVIAPNLTEAALLTGEQYREGPFEPGEVEDLLRRLAAIGGGARQGQREEHKGGEVKAAKGSDLLSNSVVLTGVTYADDPGVIGAASHDARTGEFAYAGEKRIDPMYHGTGDVFASVLTAALVNGRPLADACAAAVRYTVDSIRRTKAAGTDNRYGVDFESALSELRALVVRE
jgi:pyridoxine kinase